MIKKYIRAQSTSEQSDRRLKITKKDQTAVAEENGKGTQ